MPQSLRDIEAMWEKDSVIDQTRLDVELSRIPILHHRYYRILMEELHLARVKQDMTKELEKDLYLYYSHIMPSSEIKDRGWVDFDYHIMKSEVPRFIESDKNLQKSRLEQAAQADKVQYIKSILDTIKERQWHIKGMIDWKRFQAGSL